MKLYQKLLALGVLVAIVVFLVFDWARFLSDFYPPDRSFVGPNLVASLVLWSGGLIVLALIYPPTRHWIEKLVQNHVEALKAHASVENTLLHRKLDHIIKHHPAIPPFIGKEPSTMFDLSTLEGRFWHVLGDVESEADAIAHSHIASALEEAAKVIVPLVPEGADVEALLSHLDHAASEAHRLIAGAEPTPAPAAPEVPAATVSATSPPEAAAPAPVPAEPPAPEAPAPAAPPAATSGEMQPAPVEEPPPPPAA